MRIKLSSVFVDDQAQALRFYTEVLGFIKKRDIPLDEASWLTVVSPDEPDGTELLLEPNDNPVAQTYQQAIYDAGIPATAFQVDDVHREYERLQGHGVKFSMQPTTVGPTTMAVFDDTCGNHIQIYQAG